MAATRLLVQLQLKRLLMTKYYLFFKNFVVVLCQTFKYKNYAQCASVIYGADFMYLAEVLVDIAHEKFVVIVPFFWVLISICKDWIGPLCAQRMNDLNVSNWDTCKYLGDNHDVPNVSKRVYCSIWIIFIVWITVQEVFALHSSLNN